jgi:hypothetical protein
MRRVHIAPFIALTLMGIILIFSLDGLLGLILGFILAVLGAGGSVYHLTIDEHITL